MVSAIIFATDTCRIFFDFFKFWRSVIVSVITISSSSEASIESIASPEKMAWVAYATTCVAPCFFKADAASHSVFAVSTISSIMTHVLLATSPIMFITSDTFGFGRRLSIIARSEPKIFAQARALTTPPTSGETITKFS